MDSFKIIKRGDGFSPHVLKNEVTGKELSLCSCGGTHNTDGTCDGTHNKKAELGCSCEYCKRKVEMKTA